MIPLFKVAMSETAPQKVSNVLLSGFIGQGERVEEFEDQLWAELDTAYRPVTVNSCTTAIDLALELIGVGPGDEVISTPQTCFASQVGAMHRHARIRWADIDPHTGLIDPDSVSKLVTEKTKAIICVNWAGKFCDYEKLKSFGVPVVEDAAHTWDAKSVVEYSGSRGNYICYSLQAIKFLTTGDGGVLICDNKQDEERARILRWYGLDRTKNQNFRCTQNITTAGFKYHMNDIAASIGIENLPVARNSVKMHKQNAKYIIENVQNDLLILPEQDDTCSFWLFSMHVKNGRKQEFIKYLEDRGIASSPVHFRNDLYDCTIKYKEQELPGVHSFDQTQVCIPVGWWLTKNEIDDIITALNNFK